MADFSALKTAIQTYIKQNGNEEITGEILQEILLSVVTTLGDTAINNLVTALADEVAARQNADGTLQQNITNEATARGNADTALQGLIDGITDNIENGYVYAGIATPSSTPATGKVFYLALTAGTYTNFGSTVVSQGINILKYNGSAWSLDAFIGIDDTPTPNSPKLVKSGGAFDSVMTNGSAFDISAHFASGGTLATYADLSAALTALNTLSASYKRGGMSIKFVQSSDNKYVQYFLTKDEWSASEADWQKLNLEELGKDIGIYEPLTITTTGDHPFKVALKKGDIISMETVSASNQAFYLQNQNGDTLLTIYYGSGYAEKILEEDFEIDHIVVLNYSGSAFSATVKIRINHDARIYANEIKSQKAYNKVFFANCATAADEPVKVINIDDFDELQDCRLIIRMAHANTASNVQLKIGESSAKAMRYNGGAATQYNTWGDNQIIDVFYASSDQVYRSVLWSYNEDIVFNYDNIPFSQGTIIVPSSDSNVYAKLGRLKSGIMHIPSQHYFLMAITAYSDAMYLNKVSDMAWTADDIDIDVNPSLYYLVTMLYDFNIPDNPYEHNLHPADVEWFTYTIKLSGTISEQVKELIEKADAVDSRFEKTDVPSYYKNHIAEKCAEIIAKDQQYGQNGDSFVFITDTHVEVNYCHSASLVREIINNTGERLVIHGGDVIDSNCEKDECAPRARGWFAQFGNIHQFVSLGNHDYNTRGQIVQDPSYDLTSAEMYGVYLKQNEYRVSNPGVKNYYYIDNTTQKIRYYILDIHYFQDLDYKGNNLEISNQLDWLEDTALALGAEWTIVVVYHIHFIGAERDANGVLISATRNALAKRLMDRVDSLVDNPNFPIVAGFITGHTHYDQYDLSTKGYPIIALDCDASYNFDAGGYDQVWSPKRAKGTINEQSFNVIHIDKTSKKILITRIGYKRDDTDHPVKLEFSYDPNVPNQPDYFPINDAQ